MSEVLVTTYVNVDELVYQIPIAQAEEFILSLDSRVADYDFTKRLIDKLQASLDQEVSSE